ncbi:Ubiquitin carboxyl-terminal hydrolase 8-like 6 [Homarus americanus]|uniref:ubiquitinyl hydrolase 1 n=1 Tax=Homarus americanus TaxID=6706 RepID=A0A8J5JTC0_HOMAM|nr:Ubiquitin carboxyl-terminal hydrolase 8-like 6 [Homarus americanus]
MRRLNNTAWYDGVRQPRAHCIEQCKDSGSHVKLYNTALQYSTTTYQEGCYCCMGRVVKEAAPVHTYRTTQGNMNCCFRGTKEKSIHKKNRDDEAEIRVIRYSSQNESVISSITQINRTHPEEGNNLLPSPKHDGEEKQSLSHGGNNNASSPHDTEVPEKTDSRSTILDCDTEVPEKTDSRSTILDCDTEVPEKTDSRSTALDCDTEVPEKTDSRNTTLDCDTEVPEKTDSRSTALDCDTEVPEKTDSRSTILDCDTEVPEKTDSRSTALDCDTEVPEKTDSRNTTLDCDTEVPEKTDNLSASNDERKTPGREERYNVCEERNSFNEDGDLSPGRGRDHNGSTRSWELPQVHGERSTKQERPPTHGSARTYQRTSPPPPYSQVDKVGLPNLGNTCYMNAVIQCLYHTQELTQYFTSQYNERHLNSISVTGGEVARAYANVVSALNSGQKRKTALKELKNVCGIYDSQFKGNDQKEAHDLLGCLLYWLDQDLTTDELDCSCNKQGSSIKHMMNSNASKKQEALNNKALPEKQCQRDKICENCGVEFENGSVISRLFGGISQSTITCPESQNIVCQVHERFTNVSLAVTQPGNTHLQDLLRHHYRPQSIMWHCQYCQKEHMCTQQTRVLSQPQVLVIHLSRYNRVRYNAKLCGVDYPTTSLTLDEHLVHQRSSRSSRSLLLGSAQVFVLVIRFYWIKTTNVTFTEMIVGATGCTVCVSTQALKPVATTPPPAGYNNVMVTTMTSRHGKYSTMK